MASCSWGQPPDEFESDMDSSGLSDSEFLDSESEGKKFSFCTDL